MKRNIKDEQQFINELLNRQQIQMLQERDKAEQSFFDTFADLFTDPESLDLYQPSNGLMGQIQDRIHIYGYFSKAINNLGLDKAA